MSASERIDVGDFAGRVIESIALRYNAAEITFRDGRRRLILRDDGQDCCERRYMTCDDDLTSFAGSRLVGVEVRDCHEIPGDEVHQVQFLAIVTDGGTAVFETHNEHNGYYGGFDVVASSEGDT